MIVENKKQPEIRISGFNEKWEKRKLGDYIIPYNKVTTKNNQYPVFTSSRKGLFFQKDYYDGNQIASDDNTGYNIVPRGYFTYRHMSDDLVFKFNINNLADNGIVSTLYPVFKTTKELDSKYLQYQLNEGNEFKRFAILQKQGGSRTYMYLSKLKNMYLTMPKVDEQIKLSVFFKEFDDFISLHQQELTTLKQTKQGFLQKMFPKEGEKVPEVRFPGFTDDWELRKLSEGTYIKSRIGWQRLTKDEYLFAGDYYLITGTDIDELTHSIDLSRSVYVSKERYEKDEKIQVKEGDIIVTKDGTIGKVAMVQGLDKPATLNSHLFVLRDISGELDNRFLLHVLDSPLFTKFVEATKTGSTLTGLPQKTFVNFMYYLPSKVEQQRISELLDRLDAILALHQRELELLQLTKKAFLQKLFV